MRLISIHRRALIAIAALSVACSSGGSSSSGSTGNFVDGPVQGLRYEGDTYSGTTGPNGEYNYEPGDQVCFFLGLLPLGCTEATGIVTPIDLAENARSDDDAVQNLVRLLLSLDRDGNPDNGLDVSVVPQTAPDPGFSLDVDRQSFEEDQAVLDYIALYGPRVDLIDSETARDHFEQTLAENLVFERPYFGEWLYRGTDRRKFGGLYDARTVVINESTVESLDFAASEDGEIYLTLPDPESDGVCEVMVYNEGREIFRTDEPDSGETLYLSGYAYCGGEIFDVRVGDAVTNGADPFPDESGIEVAVLLERLDPELAYTLDDLLGGWYIQNVGTSEFVGLDAEALAEATASVSASGLVTFSVPLIGEEEPLVIPNGIIIEPPPVAPKCLYSGQMNAKKNFVGGTVACPDGQTAPFSMESDLD